MLPFAYSEFTVYKQILHWAWSFVGTEAVIYHEVPFFSYARAEKLDGFEMTLVAIGRILHYIWTIHPSL